VGNLKKSAFALRFATRSKEWTPPRYVAEGLEWLAGAPAQVTIDPNLALIAAAALVPPPETEGQPEDRGGHDD
jgi:hypothetical protein